MASEHLLVVPEYNRLKTLLSGAGDGVAGISKVEVQHLCWLGAQCPEGGDIVEIGSHRGKSTCCLAAGAKFAGVRARVFAIDLWTAGVGTTFPHYSSTETWQIFKRQVKSLGFSKVIRPVQGMSVESAARRRKPIHVLFIDANHKYAGVHSDFVAWSPFVAPGGLLAFHDYGTRFAGVDRVVNDEVLGHGEWEYVTQEHRILTVRRVAGRP